MTASSGGLRTTLRAAIAILFTISGGTQLAQLAAQLVAEQPHWARVGFHFVCGSAGMATAFAAWKAPRWGWIAALFWGAATATLLLSLHAMKLVSAEEAASMPTAAFSVVVVATLTAWYLHHIAAGERS